MDPNPHVSDSTGEVSNSEHLFPYGRARQGRDNMFRHMTSLYWCTHLLHKLQFITCLDARLKKIMGNDVCMKYLMKSDYKTFL